MKSEYDVRLTGNHPKTEAACKFFAGAAKPLEYVECIR